ncbi:hypothetical protein P3T76_002497 [Phytophthora citrophthora]|uniref:Tc1-like transposase DDE domain-containing protein n=1 Tax=Phytophthora citrophthora TaxID=4793 RepID=A0AAD9GUS6_9STRA|nr:hypothetical protein P3T76_002497 [Phytophthora citrophthora]
MEEAVTRQHAHPNTVFHCLYGFYCLGYTRKELARMYLKTVETVGVMKGLRWRIASGCAATLQIAHFLTWDEAQAAFEDTHHITISISSVWRLIHECGLTRKVLERRAMPIKEADVFCFVEELGNINCSHANLVFLDEVSFDNRGIIRRRGYSLKGKKIAVREDFQRKPRVSILAFIGVSCVLEYYDTQDTFDRVQFAQCCSDFAYSEAGNVRMYPDSHSVWILDGTSIHRDPEIVHFLRSIGIVPIFLPAYYPFFNPIAFLFGYIKRSF